LAFRNSVQDERTHRGITPLEDYYVIEINQHEFRVIDDKGEPILYPKELFEVVDPTIPAGWQFSEYEDGEYFLEPVRTGTPGFYEDFFCSNGDHAAQIKAHNALHETLEATMDIGSEEDSCLIRRDLTRLKGTKGASQ